MLTLEFWLLSLLLVLLLGYVGYRLLHEPTVRSVPGPWGLPLLGHLTWLDAAAPHKSLQMLARSYGRIFQLRMGSVKTVVLADAALVREFFRHEEFTARAPLFLTHGIMGGYGIICSEGALWKDQRRKIIDWLKAMGMTKKPGWSREQLERRISSGVDECVQSYCTEAGKCLEFDPLPALQHTLGNIINDLVFGLTYKRDDVTWLYFQELQERGVKLIGVSGVVNFLPWLRFLPSNRRIIRFLLEGKAKTHALYDRIIAQCEAKPQPAQPAVAQSSMLEQFVLERRKQLEQGNTTDSLQHSAPQLRHLLADLFGAGVDTSLATLRWFLLYMAREQACQQQLQQLLLPLSRTPSLAELEPLDYLKACLAEVQRIRSVVPLGIPHGAKRDMQVAGYHIAKGSMVIALQWAIHMDELAWPSPEQFRPERFLDANGKFAAPAQFIPFQTGKRMCPGEELAHMMLTLYVGRILRRFRLSLADAHVDMNGECGITLAPAPYRLRFELISE